MYAPTKFLTIYDLTRVVVDLSAKFQLCILKTVRMHWDRQTDRDGEIITYLLTPLNLKIGVYKTYPLIYSVNCMIKSSNVSHIYDIYILVLILF